MSFNIRNNKKCYLSTKSAYQNDKYNEMANTVIYFEVYLFRILFQKYFTNDFFCLIK